MKYRYFYHDEPKIKKTIRRYICDYDGRPLDDEPVMTRCENGTQWVSHISLAETKTYCKEISEATANHIAKQWGNFK